MDLREAHRRSVDDWQRRVSVVGVDQWEQPTPCTDWTVRELVNHVVGEDRWTVPLLAGKTIEEVGGELDGDLLGEDPIAAASAAAIVASAVVAENLPVGGKVHLSYGDEDLEEYVRQLVADHLIHAWDLAAAISGDTRLDPEVVEMVAPWFADRAEMYRSAGVVGPQVEVSDSDPQSLLLAAFGRDPEWTSPH